jgi:hypothetical protein
MRPFLFMKVGDTQISLLVAWKSPEHQKAGKIAHYDVIIVQCMKLEPYKCGNGEVLDLPKCETILRKRITKREAKRLLDLGYKPSAGYFLS